MFGIPNTGTLAETGTPVTTTAESGAVANTRTSSMSDSRNDGDDDAAVTTTTIASAEQQLPQSPTPTTQQQQQHPIVLRKYLCFAPRPDEWEKYRSTMIIQSKAVTKESIQATLDHLYELHPQFRCYFSTDDDAALSHASIGPFISTTNEPTATTTASSTAINTSSSSTIPQLRRTGPGRKSNAEYAIQFYEYILQQFNTVKHSSGSVSSNNDNNNDDVHGAAVAAVCRTNQSLQLPQPRSNIPRLNPNTDDTHNVDDKKMAATPKQEGPVVSCTSARGSKARDSTPVVDQKIQTKKKQTRVCEVCCQSITTAQTTTTVVEDTTITTIPPPWSVQCATCPKAFHTACVRPKWDTPIVPPMNSSTNNDGMESTDLDDSNHQHPTTDTSTQQPQHHLPYKCAYCIMSTYKRNDRHRKQAAAAVRFMARLRKQHEQQQQQGIKNTSESENIVVMEDVMIEDSHDDGDENVDTQVEEVNVKEDAIEISPQMQPADTAHVVDESIPLANVSSPTTTTSERNIKPAQSTIYPTETMTPESKETTPADGTIGTLKLNIDPTSKTTEVATTLVSSSLSSPARSSRRCRKQPTLYNPQDGPASRWQTDELTEWKLQRAKEEEEEEAKIQALKASEEAALPSSRMTSNDATLRKAFRHEKKEGGVICNFCHDDPNIPVCVFCACRACFSKHCQNELLLCDNCDEEYHIFCLNPPLKCVPAPNQPWYCVHCSKRDENDTSARLSRRGNVDTTKSMPGAGGTSDANNASPSSRRSLRSPKLSAAALQMLSSVKETTYEKIIPSLNGASSGILITKKSAAATKPMKRPRGRPPKMDASTAATTTHVMSSSSEHSSDGTIFKGIAKYAMKSGADSPGKRRPGRPPTKSNEISSEGKTKSSVQQPSMGRKRGRPPSAETIAKRAKLDAMARKAARQQAKSIFTLSSSTVAVPAPQPLSVNKKSISECATLPVAASTMPTAAANDTNNESSAVASPIIVSRSGRTVRRSNFHDELADTEQHLKTIRNNNERNSNPIPSPRSTGCITATNATTSALPNDSASRFLETKLTISIHSTTGVASGPPTISSQAGGSVAAEQNDSDYVFDSSSMKMPALESASNFNQNVDHGGYDDNESFDQDEMSATYNTVNQNIQGSASEIHPTTDGTGATQQLPSQSQHQSQNSLDALKQPRRKPGARECMQISRRFGVKEIPQQYMDTLLDYCNRGKVEHLIRMRERLDEHSRFLEMQLAGLESLVLERGESDIVVPLAPPSPDRRHE